MLALIRNLLNNPATGARGPDFGGKGNLLNDGARALRLLHTLGCRRFVICLDSDDGDAGAIRAEAERRIVGPSGVSEACCIVVPVRAIESWILADIDAAIGRWKKHPQWSPSAEKNPEGLADPKARLMHLSREGQARPRYSPPTDNPLIAAHLDLDRVATRCPSFHPLCDYVLGA